MLSAKEMTQITLPGTLKEFPPGSPCVSKQQVRVLHALWPYLKPYSRTLGLTLLALLGAATATLAIPYAVRHLIDSGILASGSDWGADNIYFVALLLLASILAFCSAMRYYLVTRLGERVVADLRKKLYRHLIRMGPSFFERYSVGDILLRLNADTTLVQIVVGGSLSVAMRSAIILAGSFVMLLVTNWYLGGMVLLLVPLVVFPIVILGRQVRRLSRISQDQLAEGGGLATETLHSVQTVQILNMEVHIAERFSALTERAFYAACARTRVRAVLTAVAIFIVTGAVVMVLWRGSHEVFQGHMASGELGQFLLYAVLLAGSAGGLSEIWGDVQRAAGAMERLLELLEIPADTLTLTRPCSLPVSGAGEIDFQGLCFHYPSRPQVMVLRDFSLHIEPGENVALVGANGTGKTTVFRLLLRMYDPYTGQIRVDGMDIAKVPPSEVRSRIALVPQETVLFTGSVLDNIRYGRPEATDREVMRAAQAALVSEFAEDLPEGYDTPLGEHGKRLSGGQQQRIVIARAILKNPLVMLLDEAISALDTESGLLVQQALQQMMRKHTTLVIAHQLTTVKRADRIVVLDKGRIVAEGHHAELMRQGGLYRRLVELELAAEYGEAPRRQVQAGERAAEPVRES